MSFAKKILVKLKSSFLGSTGDVAKNLQCAEFEVDNWRISKFIVNKLIPTVGVHPYPISELNLMAATICRLKPEQVFEWGTNIGKSARIFHETSIEFKIPLLIHSIDLPDDSPHNEHPKSSRGRMVKGYPNVSLYQADGLTKAVELYQQHPNKRTLVFIDGDHSYDSVLRELNGVIAHMPTAWILLHDTFYQSEASGYNVGPHRAVKETLASSPSIFRVMETATGLPGMTLLYKL